MTDILTARLTAIGVKLAEVAEYGEAERLERIGGTYGLPNLVSEREADAALAAVVGELEKERGARRRHAKLEREAVIAAGGAIDRAEQAEAEVAALQAWVDDLQSGMYINCVYCGHRYGPDDDIGGQSMRGALEAHIAVCPEHPLSLAKAEVARLTKILRDYAGEKEEQP